MRFVPRIPVGLQDPKLIKIFTDILQVLGNVLQSNTYTLERVWSVPFSLQIPTAGNMTRLDSPDTVELGRALVVGDEETPVHTGSVLWKWSGDGSVRILDVAGLVQGVKYRLTFRVEG